jgi:hypothetical protein
MPTPNPGVGGRPVSARERAEILVAELDLVLDEVRRDPPFAAEAVCPYRLHRAAGEAAEAARILETHSRKAGLTPEQAYALERYETIHERAHLILLEHFPYPHA